MRTALSLLFESVRKAMAAVAEAVRALLDWARRTRQALASAVQTGVLLAAPSAPWHGDSRPPRRLLPAGGWRPVPLGRPAYRPRC